MAACSPSSGSKSGAFATIGATTSTSAIAAKVRRNQGMCPEILSAFAGGRRLDQRDERVVVGAVALFGPPHLHAPPLGQAEQQMVEPHRPERGPSILFGRGSGERRQFAIGGVVEAEPCVEITAKRQRPGSGQDARERAGLPQ